MSDENVYTKNWTPVANINYSLAFELKHVSRQKCQSVKTQQISRLNFLKVFQFFFSLLQSFVETCGYKSGISHQTFCLILGKLCGRFKVRYLGFLYNACAFISAYLYTYCLLGREYNLSSGI